MKKYVFGFLIIILVLPAAIQAQIKNVIVETYYVSDARDATDITDGRSLDSGSVAYRVYIDLQPGYKIRKIYGDSLHTLKIASTAIFFNNIDRPAACFGYLINKTWFQDNPTLALDSWITLGLATRTNKGVLKSEDTDGSFIGGANNSGGSAGISGGLLINADSAAGVPLTTADGLAPINEVLSQWSDKGFRDLSGADTTIFGSTQTGSQFISNNAYLQQNLGVIGAAADSNKILVAQLTTTGTISFDLNIEVSDSNGTAVNFVSNGNLHVSAQHDHDTLLCPFLTYPPRCGCKDPNYLEYSPNYACNIQDSCRTHIVFGCMDTMACNYDPNANFNLPLLCCYPGYCNDRNLSFVCPSLNMNRIRLFPNPAKDDLALQVSTDNDKEIKYCIYDSFGRLRIEKNISIPAGISVMHMDVSQLNIGMYMVRIIIDNEVVGKAFMKN